jgi:antitoxin MazE
MKTRVSKWGNSLAIRVPAVLADEMALREGTEIELSVHDGELKGRAINDVPTLDELLDKLDPATLHGEIDWGKPAGNEVW